MRVDQCNHCTVNGNLEECLATDCNQHESWMVKQLRADNLQQAERIKELTDLRAQVVSLKNEVVKLNERVEKSEKDTALLNWIERQDFDLLDFILFKDQPNDGKYGVKSTGSGWSVGATLREAIHAAIAKEPK